MQTELITGGALLLGGIAIAIHALKKPTDTKTPSQAVIVEQAKSSFINIYDGETLILMNKLDPLIAQCRDRMGFDYAIFKNDCLPLIYKSAEWVQMLPASESHHHAQPGGLVLHMLESASVALRLRQGYLLPVGAAPEEIPERKHRWTYAVFLAALLHDIGRPIADIQVKLKNNAFWQPLAGSMVEQGIDQYKLNFEIKKRDYELHKRLPIILFQRLVPAHVLTWLAQDSMLMQELTSYLSGDSQHDGAIKEIVTKADSESVRQNLLLGPRTRFAAAKTIPLIERLMQALRIMLEEGRFSLNRAGAHGWVWDNKLWFVSKRVADDVRSFLIERESGEGIPGKDKNDRIFDTWQEYGALITTPENKAIWSINVNLDDGWSKDFTVICFSLDKLFADPSQYPKPVAGRITVNTGAVIESNEVEQEEPLESHLSGAEAVDESSSNFDSVSSATNEFTTSITEPESALDVGLPIPIIKVSTPEPDNGFTQIKPPSMTVLNTKAIDDVFLDEEDIAKPAPKAGKTLNAAPIKPITPHDAKGLPAIGKAKKTKGPSSAALRFMRWIQDGLADGSMSYNRADSNIHFTQEGMALVSPRVFKEFAQKYGEDGTGTASDKSPADLGQGIQRHITNTGWHLQVGEKNSISSSTQWLAKTGMAQKSSLQSLLKIR